MKNYITLEYFEEFKSSVELSMQSMKKELDFLKNDAIIENTENTHEATEYEAKRYDIDGNPLLDFIVVSDADYNTIKPEDMWMIKIPYYHQHPAINSYQYKMYKVAISECLNRLVSPIVYKFDNQDGMLELEGMALSNSIVLIFNDDIFIGYSKTDGGGKWKFKSNKFNSDYIISLYSMNEKFQISTETDDIFIGSKYKRDGKKKTVFDIWKMIMEDDDIKILIFS